jgi:acetyltransferase-like isoleucine patch superfamily enzyme
MIPLKFVGFAARLIRLKVRYGNRLRLQSFSQALSSGARIRILGESCVSLADRVSLGNNVLIDAQCGATVSLGRQVFINRGSSITGRYAIEIGEETLIGEYVTIYDHNHHIGSPDTPRRLGGFTGAPVVIGRNVWLGSHVFIGAGVSIGDNAVVGAHTIVTKNIPANTVTYGQTKLVTRSIHSPIHMLPKENDDVLGKTYGLGGQ